MLVHNVAIKTTLFHYKMWNTNSVWSTMPLLNITPHYVSSHSQKGGVQSMNFLKMYSKWPPSEQLYYCILRLCLKFNRYFLMNNWFSSLLLPIKRKNLLLIESIPLIRQKFYTCPAIIISLHSDCYNIDGFLWLLWNGLLIISPSDKFSLSPQLWDYDFTHQVSLDPLMETMGQRQV